MLVDRYFAIHFMLMEQRWVPDTIKNLKSQVSSLQSKISNALDALKMPSNYDTMTQQQKYDNRGSRINAARSALS